MICCRCGKHFYECDSMSPIDPPGTKGRRWVCSDCETPDERANIDPEVKKYVRMILDSNKR